MKNITKGITGFCKLIVNTIKTPFRYKLDYFLSVININHSQRPLPWMNYEVIDCIRKLIKENSRVFEYGSGQSTLFWLSEGAEVVSVEHDEDFYKQLFPKLKGLIKYLLIKPELSSEVDIYNPASSTLFQSSSFEGYSFEKYVKSIDAYDDEFFDFVIVDGRARPSCIKNSISKVKSGGKLIIDNSDRDYYFIETSQMLAKWQKETFRGPVRGLLHLEQTTVFTRP